MRKYLISILAFVTVLPMLSHADSFVVMRHGEAKQNILRILNGDIKLSEKFPLTLLGETQVHDAAKALKKDGIEGKTIRAIYTSPLLRARQTAEMLARDLGVDASQVFIDDRLRENGMGRLEGQPERELDKLDPGFKGYLPQAKELFEGENRVEIETRLRSFLTSTKSSSPGHVIIVTHGTPSFVLLPMLDPKQEKKPELKRGQFRIINLPGANSGI